MRLVCAEFFPGCPVVAEADTVEEILESAATHCARDHDLPSLDDATVDALKAAIKPA